ncbi:response regulator [Pleurocapsa sp. PCC 7327]|uniref:response regulator n=1 Tax=Pleurocapsa sp. PCC 7327 TaxID=118163 RepID=UPI001C2F27BF|nr:response regulator [Pleurocapsa sp. PCC 7327]
MGGWQVLEAASGEEGLLEVQTRKPDAIILDIEMDGMNGIEFLQRLRANPEHQKIPVVLLTVIADWLAPQELSKLGVVKILAKPFKLSALITQIAEVLE